MKTIENRFCFCNFLNFSINMKLKIMGDITCLALNIPDLGEHVYNPQMFGLSNAMLEHQKVFSTGSHGNGPEMVVANSRSSPCLGLNRCIHYHLWKSNHVKSRFLLVKICTYHQFDCFESPLVVAPRSTSFHQTIHCRCPATYPKILIFSRNNTRNSQ